MYRYLHAKLPAEMPQAWLVVPGLQLLLQSRKGCCRAPVCPSCAAVLDAENEHNVIGCQRPGKQAKLLINMVSQVWRGTASQMQDCFWMNRVVL